MTSHVSDGARDFSEEHGMRSESVRSDACGAGMQCLLDSTMGIQEVSCGSIYRHDSTMTIPRKILDSCPIKFHLDVEIVDVKRSGHVMDSPMGSDGIGSI